MHLQKTNRVSIMFDVNIPKSARLSMKDNIQWEIIEKDEKKLDTVSNFEMKASNFKSYTFNARYKFVTGGGQ